MPAYKRTAVSAGRVSAFAASSLRYSRRPTFRRSQASMSGVGLQTHLLGRQGHLRMLELRGLQRSKIVVTFARQLAPKLGPLEIDKVIRRLGLRQLRLSLIAPSVGLRTEILERVERLAVPQKGGDVRREIGRGQAIDHAVAVRSPGPALLLKKNANQQNRHWAPQRSTTTTPHT